MKKIIFTLLIGISAIMLLESFGKIYLGKKDGTDPGYTGSPGDSLKNCTVCHGGSAIPIANWITSNIPSSGYVPGNTYTITTTNYGVGHNRFGFSISPQTIDGDLLGTMIITDTIKTKLVGDSKYITYTAAGIESTDSMVWQFDWTAPAAGNGDVVFYGAYNSNHDGNKGGDVTFLSTLRVKETGTASIKPEFKHTNNFTIYPNPSCDNLTINFDNQLSNANVEISLIDIKSKQITVLMDKNENSNFKSKQFDLSNFANGIYLLIVRTNNTVQTSKISILH